MSASQGVGAIPLYAGRAQSVSLAQIPVNTLGLKQALKNLDGFLDDGGFHYLCFCEANLFVHAQQSARVLAAVSGADIVFADGVCMCLLAKLLAKESPLRITGPSFMLAACKHGLKRGYRHYFYGGGDGVADRLASNLSTMFPGIQIVGLESPPFRPLTPEEEIALRQRIETARPDVMWVGLGGPKQELWMANHLGRLKAPVMLGVGAAFDFHSGNRKWAPKWIRRIGMEWAYRALTGGTKTFSRNLRCVNLTTFYLLRAAFQRLFGRDVENSSIANDERI